VIGMKNEIDPDAKPKEERKEGITYVGIYINLGEDSRRKKERAGKKRKEKGLIELSTDYGRA